MWARLQWRCQCDRQAALLACIRNNKLITKSARVDSAKLIRGSARVEKKKRLRDSDGRKTGALEWLASVCMVARMRDLPR